MSGNPLARVFLKGLVTLLPVALTLYLLIALTLGAESAFKKLLLIVLPANWYVPGMGLFVGVVVVLVAGLLSEAWLFRKLFSWGERLFERVPLVKSVYGALRDMFTYFSGSGSRQFSRAVMVSFADTPMQLFGFVTRESFEDLPRGFGGPDLVAVYLPMSYQIGGYMVIVPRAWIKPVDVSFEEGMRIALMAGVVKSAAKDQPGKSSGT